jgi:DNA repair protein RadA/Sms
MAEEIIDTKPTTSATKKTTNLTPKARPISEITYERFNRETSGISEFDNVLGGGIVAGSLILLGGDPGIGKSTLLTQIAAHLSAKHKVLYFSAEESCSQVKMRATRLNLPSENLLLINETCIDNLESELDGVEYCVIDSIQAVYTDDLTSSAGSVGQVRECAAKIMRIAKSRGITFFIVGHVTKEGALAGPKVLEHIMDTVLYFEGENQENYRILRAVKNRFGNVAEVGVFEMTGEGIIAVTDYSGIFLSESRGEEAGCAVTPAQTGNRVMNVEIQTLVSKTSFGLPRRMPLGIDYNKLVLLLAVLEKRCGVPFNQSDVYINAMGGIKLNEPSCDLAICAALASAYFDMPIDK